MNLREKNIANKENRQNVKNLDLSNKYIIQEGLYQQLQRCLHWVRGRLNS